MFQSSNSSGALLESIADSIIKDILTFERWEHTIGETSLLLLFDVQVVSVEYKYRYVLACPLDLTAYWRHCRVPETFHATVPMDLCATMSLRSHPVHMMKTVMMKGLVDYQRHFTFERCPRSACRCSLCPYYQSRETEVWVSE